MKKFRLNKVSWKVATCVRKSLYVKIMKWQKVSHQDKKNWKYANLSKCTDSLKGILLPLLNCTKFKPSRCSDLLQILAQLIGKHSIYNQILLSRVTHLTLSLIFLFFNFWVYFISHERTSKCSKFYSVINSRTKWY